MALTLTNAEIVSRLKILSDFHVKADSGTTTTAIIKKLVEEEDVTGYYICFINGANYGIDRIVTDFYDADGVLVFDAVSSAITNTSEICLLEKGYLSDATQAEMALANYLRNKGYDIDLFLTTAQLKEAHIYKTLEIICGYKMNEANDTDVYYSNKEKFKMLFESEMAKLIADYDDNEDGIIDDDEELQKLGQIGFVR